MTRTIRAEWVRLLRTTSLLAIGLPFVVLPALITVFAFAAGSGKPGPGPASHLTVSAAELAAWDGYVAGLRSASTVIGVMVMVMVTTSLGGDYTHATLRNLLIRQPNRLRFFLGKLLAILTVVVVVAAVAVAVSIMAAWIAARSYGVSTGAWASILTQSAASWLGLVAAAIGWAAAGAALVTLLRSTAAAIAVGVVWALPVEASLSAAWPGGERWLPAAVFSAVANGGTETIALATAATVGALYAAAAYAVAASVFRARDVRA